MTTVSKQELDQLRTETYQREKVAYGYDGKPEHWKIGFDRGFKESWNATVDFLTEKGIVQ